MRTPQDAVIHNTTVEMNQRLPPLASPFGHALARPLDVLADGVVIDRVEMPIISGNGLVRFPSRDAPNLLGTPPRLCPGRQSNQPGGEPQRLSRSA